MQYLVCAIIGVAVFFGAKYGFEKSNETREEAISYNSIIIISLILGISSGFISLFVYNKYIEYTSSRMVMKDGFYN